MNKLKQSLSFKLCLLIPLIITLLSSLFSRNATQIYQTLRRPPLSPPGIWFPIIWFTLAVLNGISLYLLYTTDCKEQRLTIRLWFLAYTFIFFWPIFFFTLQLRILALIWLLGLIVINGFLLYHARKCSVLAFRFMLPYGLWSIFALYLNLGFVLLNVAK